MTVGCSDSNFIGGSGADKKEKSNAQGASQDAKSETHEESFELAKVSLIPKPILLDVVFAYELTGSRDVGHVVEYWNRCAAIGSCSDKQLNVKFKAISAADLIKAKSIKDPSLKLADFHRKGAFPLYLIGDNTPQGMGPDHFKDLRSESYITDRKPVVFAVAVRKEGGDCQDSAGSFVSPSGYTYEELAADTDGMFVDACAKPNTIYDKLSLPPWFFIGIWWGKIPDINKVSHIRSINLERDITRVLEVSVDGRKLSDSEFTVSGKTIEVNEEAAPKDAKVLKVLYEVSKPQAS